MKKTVVVKFTQKFSYGCYELIQTLAGLTPAEKIEKGQDNKVAKKKEIIRKLKEHLGEDPVIECAVVLNAILKAVFLIPIAARAKRNEVVVSTKQLTNIISKGKVLITESTKKNAEFDKQEVSQFYNQVFFE